MQGNTRPALPGMKAPAQPARFDGFGQRRLGQALLNHPQQASNPPSPFATASGTPRPSPLAGAPGSYANSPGVRPGPNFDIYSALNRPSGAPGAAPGSYASGPGIPGNANTDIYAFLRQQPTLSPAPGGPTAQVEPTPSPGVASAQTAPLQPRFADFGKQRLAQALLNRPELAQRQQSTGNGGVVAPETPQVPAQVAGANPAQPAPVTPEMMSLMLTGRPDPTFSAQNYYNQGIMPQHTGEGMIDPRFMVPPGQGQAKTSWLDQINAMMARPTQ